MADHESESLKAEEAADVEAEKGGDEPGDKSDESEEGETGEAGEGEEADEGGDETGDESDESEGDAADEADEYPPNYRHDPDGLINQPFIPPDGPDWHFKPRAVFTLIKDAAPAASIAARHVFCFDGEYPMTSEERQRARKDPDPLEYPTAPKFRELSCHMHASLRWCHQNRDKFEPYSLEEEDYTARQARNQFRADLDYVIKDLPMPHMTSVALGLLKSKWESRGNEVAVNAWLKSWGKCRLTRSEANEVDASPFRGGIPCDNNALESSNNVDKQLLSREQATATEFIADLAEKLVGPLSAADTQYCGQLKERCNEKATTRFSKAPNNAQFFDHVRMRWKEFNLDLRDESIARGHERPHTLNCCIKLNSNRALDIPAHSYWFVSDHGIADFQAHMVDTEYDPDDTEHFWRYVDDQNWSLLINRIIYTPAEAVEDEQMTFDEFAEWLQCFHILRPIHIANDDNNFPGNRSLVHWLHMMKISGIECASYEDIILSRKKIMFSCTCSMYLHYMICKHTLLFYLHSGIVTKLPKGAKSLLNRKSGRKRKARGGDALVNPAP